MTDNSGLARNFDRVIQTWTENGRDISTLNVRMDQIKDLDAQVFENLDGDINVCEEVMLRFADYLVADMNQSIVDVFLGFCYSASNCRCGPIRDSASGHYLGRLQCAEVLLDNVRRDPSDILLSQDDGDVWLDSLTRSTLADQKDKLGPSLPLTRPCRTVWSWFLEGSQLDPFLMIPKTRDLVRRLGLPFGASEKLISWGHVLDDARKPHWPTAFDAALNHLYRPGGKTWPLDAIAEPHDGLDEVVHEQLVASDLTIAISVVL